MGVERNYSPPRTSYAIPNNTFATTSSAVSRHAAATRPPPMHQGRTDSPPASAYFSEFVGEQEPQPITPETSSHFAYSTTLRRHSLSHSTGVTTFGELRTVVAEEGPSGLWQRITAPIRGYLSNGSHGGDYERLPMQSLKEERHETPSSRFVYLSAQVSESLLGVMRSCDSFRNERICAGGGAVCCMSNHPRNRDMQEAAHLAPRLFSERVSNVVDDMFTDTSGNLTLGYPIILPYLGDGGSAFFCNSVASCSTWLQRVLRIKSRTPSAEVCQDDIRESSYSAAMWECCR